MIVRIVKLTFREEKIETFKLVLEESKEHIRAFNLVGGSMLIVVGVLLMTGLWMQFTNWLQVVTSGFQLPL